MAVITTVKYKELVDDYTLALSTIEGVADNYLNAANVVLELNTFDTEIDLLVPFHNAYLVANVSFSAQPQSVVNAVTALQQHVLSRGRNVNGVGGAVGTTFSSINDYYADDGTFDTPSPYFTSGFAALSTQAGFTIDPDLYVIV